jgi:hypothetical protein
LSKKRGGLPLSALLTCLHYTKSESRVNTFCKDFWSINMVC